jgi:hypothetical protein
MDLDSPQLVEYMRTGSIRPLAKGDTKSQVESKLGPPDSWKGHGPDYCWEGPYLSDFHDSYAWHYGSLFVVFPDAPICLLPGIHLNYYTQVFGPVRFSPPFAGLPLVTFTIRELINMLRRHNVQFEDVRPDMAESLILISEGGIAARSLGGDCSPEAQIIELFPHEHEGA